MPANLANAPDLSINLGQRRPRLVLDPWLCLDAAGPILIQRLQAFAELWIVRELWHILDDSHYFSEHPRALVSERAPGLQEYRALFDAPGERRAEGAPVVRAAHAPAARDVAGGRADDLVQTLLFWDRTRLATDLAGLKLFWMGDGLSESLLPEGTAASVHEQHERLAQWLDEGLAPRSPVACAQRDALALSLALGGVPVLCLLDRDGEAFSLPSWLGSRQVRCAELARDDRWLGIERETWASLLVRANCAPLLWSGLRLAVVHLHAARCLPLPALEPVDPEDAAGTRPQQARWDQLSAFWYAL